jgi:hypothetical protein
MYEPMDGLSITSCQKVLEEVGRLQDCINILVQRKIFMSSEKTRMLTELGAQLFAYLHLHQLNR